MKDKQQLYTYVEVDDSVPIQKLSIGDQLRVLLKHITYDPANELQAEDAVTTERLMLRATLSDFIKKATLPLRNGEKKSVVITVNSKFKPVLKEVLASNEISRYYTVAIASPSIEYDIEYDVMVKLTVK